MPFGSSEQQDVITELTGIWKQENIESLFSHVRQRTDQIDAFTRRYELPDHCVGGDAGYSPAHAVFSEPKERTHRLCVCACW